MSKAKTKRNILTILSAVLGAVFALIVGVTYCVTSLNLTYGNNPKSTTAYLGNQQYHIVNDTLETPVIFGEGAHNFEIALQYSFDYDFDVRFKYEMKWLEGTSSTTATNVILHFANRNNIIYDEDYIYLANSISAGSGKLTIITGVDFVDTQDETYIGKTLKINITETKVYKTQSTYDENHYLYEDNTSSVAAQAWLYNKNKSTSDTAYVMMYNYRRNYTNGVPYPGLNSAYKKPVTTSTTTVSGSAWAGGNRAYAGTGMYIIPGKTAIKLQVEVSGIWRTSSGDVTDKSLISESSVKYNYTSDWTHASWDGDKLWETRTYNFVIPANTACYIDILDSVEITSANRIVSNLYDSYRLVTNQITINPTLSSSTVFEYKEGDGNAEFVQLKSITSNTALTAVTKNYSASDITVVNSSTYSNGLYTAYVGASASEQTFNTNLSLINNTNQTKTVTLTYQLWYHISNANSVWADATTTGEGETAVTTYTRAEEYVANKTYTDAQAFASDLHYSYALQADADNLTSATTASVVIDPYSSVNLLESYKVAAALQTDVTTLFGKSSTEGVTNNYDVWTYLVVSATATTSSTAPNLAIETKQTGNTISLNVKNNTNKKITGITVSSVEVKELSNATYSALTNQPSDWDASFWKYYTKSGDVYTALTAKPESFSSGTYYQITQAYGNITLTTKNSFVQSGSTFTNSSISLLPGETIEFATATTSATGKVIVSGKAKATTITTQSTLMLINNGKSNAFIINNTTSTSYYIRFSGTYTGTDTTNIRTVSSYNYYIGILRPGQILSVPMSSSGEIDEITATGNYSASTLSSWDSTMVTLMTNLFTVK